MAVAPTRDLLEEITSFLAASPTTEEIIAFKPSEILDQRLHYLLDQNGSDTLSGNEKDELNEFLLMNHFLKMLKLKAQLNLSEAE
ncbi:MAG: hypothetical protein GC204_03325 [Chloroflexi bacterium]|nr:hypothetical protein [Chloroflexota bacterium]